jgi:hypothetical protein
VRGYPIRTPSDHSSVDSSPRLIAASHVLHRLLVPRHPPCALENLHTQKTKKKDARVHYADLKQQTHNQPRHRQPQPHTRIEAVRTPAGRERQQDKPVPSDTQQRTHDPPTPPPPVPAGPKANRTNHDKRIDEPHSQCSTHEQPPRNTRPRNGNWTTHQKWTATCSLERR